MTNSWQTMNKKSVQPVRTLSSLETQTRLLYHILISKEERMQKENEKKKTAHSAIFQWLLDFVCNCINQSINQSVDQSINQSINQSISRTINQSVEQSINQSVDQSINQNSTRLQKKPAGFVGCFFCGGGGLKKSEVVFLEKKRKVREKKRTTPGLCKSVSAFGKWNFFLFLLKNSHHSHHYLESRPMASLICDWVSLGLSRWRISRRKASVQPGCWDSVASKAPRSAATAGDSASSLRRCFVCTSVMMLRTLCRQAVLALLGGEEAAGEATSLPPPPPPPRPNSFGAVGDRFSWRKPSPFTGTGDMPRPRRWLDDV